MSNIMAGVSFVTPGMPPFLKKPSKSSLEKNKKKEIAAATSTISKAPLTPEEIQIDLKEPMFTQGVIKTDKGGVIKAEGIRIQAQNIEYINKIENGIRVLKVIAETDLMMEYGEQVFVGQKLEFDFNTRTGTIWDAKTDVDIWFLGGDKIELQKDGSYYIDNAFITTCESNENIWEINSETINISKERTLSANNIQFKFFKVPIFWFPVFRSNLKVFYDSPIKYKIDGTRA
jgi:lipopolysaccharide assembly outer membrane protein LptD (OstA)